MEKLIQILDFIQNNRAIILLVAGAVIRIFEKKKMREKFNAKITEINAKVK